MAMFAMDPPVEFHAEDLRDEKLKVLRAVKPMSPAEVATNTVRGQYVSGWVEGEKVTSYRDEPEVAPDSQTETFVALKLGIDSWRWAGVPFYLRSGKALPSRVTEIAVQFKQAPLALFARAGVPQIEPNVLAIRVQPDEGILLRFGAKVPGQGLQIRNVNMDFRYGSSFAVDSPDAYETLLLDCDGRRRQPLHPRRRGGACLGDPGPDPRRMEVRPGRPAPLLRGRDVGPAGGRRAARARRPSMAPAMNRAQPPTSDEVAVHRRLMRFGEAESLATPMWEEPGTSVRAIASHLASLWDPPAGFDDGGDPLVTEKGLPHARASVLNLIVTVADEAAAERVVHTLVGLGVRHPSRAIVLVAVPRRWRADRRAHQHALQ